VTQAGVDRPKEFGHADADIVELTTAAGTAAKFAKFANFALTFDICESTVRLDQVTRSSPGNRKLGLRL